MESHQRALQEGYELLAAGRPHAVILQHAPVRVDYDGFPIRYAEKLGIETLVLTECGHGYKSYTYDAERWLGKPLPFRVEVISRLASVDGLRVISRTSAMQYKGDHPPLSQIAADLGVDYVLEGTVRWAKSPAGPGRVRITPQLIRVSDDVHMWSERYDRTLEEIFAVQSAVAEEVIARVGVELLGRERAALDARPTDNPDAYAAYLRGVNRLNDPDYSESTFRMAAQMFERALELNATFLATKVTFAEYYALKIEDRQLFTRLLTEVTEADRAALAAALTKELSALGEKDETFRMRLRIASLGDFGGLFIVLVRGRDHLAAFVDGVAFVDDRVAVVVVDRLGNVRGWVAPPERQCIPACRGGFQPARVHRS